MSKLTQNTDFDGNDIELLLPWYVAGTLDAQDQKRVESYIADNPEISHQLNLIREELDETVFSNEALVPPSPASFDNLFARISAEQPVSKATERAKGGILQIIDGFVGGLSPMTLRWTGVALVVLLIGQAIVIGNLIGTNIQNQNSFHTATDPEQKTVKGTYIFVRFTNIATAEQINSFLNERKAVIVDGPKPGGLYKVRISRSVLGETELNKLIQIYQKDHRIVDQAFPAH